MPWIEEDAPFVSPIEGTIGGGFTDPRGHGPHNAVDWTAPAGTPVRAPGNMRFIQGRMGGTGLRGNDWWSHWEDVDTGVQYRFAHHGPLTGIEPGQVVRKGQTWNVVGNVISGPHLHMGLWYQGKPINYYQMAGMQRGQHVGAGEVIDFGRRAGAIAAKTKGKWVEVQDEPTASQTPPVAPKAGLAPVAQAGPEVAPDAITRAAQQIAKMPAWQRGAFAALIDAAQGAGLEYVAEPVGKALSYLGLIKAPTEAKSYKEGLEKARQALAQGQKLATGSESFGLAERLKVPGFAAMTPAFGGAQAAVTGAMKYVPGLSRIAGAAETLPWVKGLAPRAVTGAAAFPTIDFLMHGEAPTLGGAGIGAGMGALLGRGAFRVPTVKPTEIVPPTPASAEEATKMADDILSSMGMPQAAAEVKPAAVKASEAVAPTAPPPIDVLPWQPPSHRPQDIPAGGSVPAIFKYGPSRGRVPSRDIWHERQIPPTVPLSPQISGPRSSVPSRTKIKDDWQIKQDVDEALGLGVGRGDANVNKMLRIIRDLGGKGVGEAPELPWKYPPIDPLLEKMRQLGGG